MRAAEAVAAFALAPEEELSYRLPLAVTSLRAFPSSFGLTTYPVCPRCGDSLDREYQAYCDRCGQALNWLDLHKATIIMINE